MPNSHKFAYLPIKEIQDLSHEDSRYVDFTKLVV